jgi:hypothetical protein
MGELKSALDIAMEKAKKMGGEGEIASLTPEQKKQIADVRQVYAAKMAEAEILIQDPEKLEKERDHIRRERDRKIEAIYEKVKGK